MSQGPVLVLDSASLYYRAFYALPDSMKAPDGRPHQALRGFLSMLDSFQTTFDPKAIVACWDVDWRPQWRVDLLPSYKTHRVLEITDGGDALEDEPDTLSPQIDALAAILDVSSIARIGVNHFEADDVAATLAKHIDGPVIVISGDRDLVQVVSDSNQVQLLLAVNGGMPKWPLMNEAGVMDRYGVSPSSYVDFAIMRGDSSDGIPGVPGIGEKTASALIQAFGNLEGVIRAARAEPKKPMTPRLAGLILEHTNTLEISQKVATAATDIPIDIHAALTQTQRNEQARDALAVAWGVDRFIPTWL
jgi:5'-3' exonuclease